MTQFSRGKFLLHALSATACLLASLAAVARAEHHRRGPARIEVAVTIDDLPASGDPTPGWSKARILNSIADALRKHHVPAPVGFFNGANVDADPATREALDSWLNAGFVLGNHTFSHQSAETAGAAQFERDIEHDQALIVELESHHERAGNYFRYPFLERGDGHDERTVRKYLLQHKYRIADVSIDFEDWAFSETYARCSARADQDALAALTDSYLDYALAELYWSDDTLRRLVGRPIPQVLLVHANVLTAQLLDALLGTFAAAGVKFIRLDEALDDAAYAQAQRANHGDTTLVRALIQERRAHIRNYVPLPTSLLAALCH